MNKKIISCLLSLLTILFVTGCKSAPVKEPSLTDLIKAGKIDEARDRFETKYDINEIDAEGNTALHLAAAMDDADLVTFLLIKKADIDLKNYESKTPLHMAISNNAKEAAQVLVQFGANLFARDGEGIAAIDAGFNRDVAFYDIFITAKTGEIRDSEDGRSIVHYFVQTKNEQAINTCVKKSIPLSVKDNNGCTPLDLAFNTLEDIKGVEIAACLIMNGADQVETEYEYFQTAIANRNLNYRFDDGQTPLHLASIYGHTPIVSYLLENNVLTNTQIGRAHV